MKPIPSAHILVVDDNAELCDLIRESLTRDGLTVETAGSLAAARDAVARRKVDLVIADLRLPDGTGGQLLDELRLRVGDLPAILITGCGDLALASEACRAGCVDVLTKPLDLSRLRNAVARELTRRRRAGRRRQLARQMNRQRRDAKHRLDTTGNALTVAYRTLSQQFTRQETLLRFQRHLLASGDDDDVFRGLFGLFSTDRDSLFGIALVCDPSADLQIIGRFGTPAPDSLSICRAVASSLLDVVLDDPRVMRLELSTNSSLFPDWLGEHLPDTTLLSVPLLSKPGRLIGLAVLYRKDGEGFTDDEVALAELIGPSIAVTIKGKPQSGAA